VPAKHSSQKLNPIAIDTPTTHSVHKNTSDLPSSASITVPQSGSITATSGKQSRGPQSQKPMKLAPPQPVLTATSPELVFLLLYAVIHTADQLTYTRAPTHKTNKHLQIVDLPARESNPAGSGMPYTLLLLKQIQTGNERALTPTDPDRQPREPGR